MQRLSILLLFALSLPLTACGPPTGFVGQWHTDRPAANVHPNAAATRLTLHGDRSFSLEHFNAAGQSLADPLTGAWEKASEDLIMLKARGGRLSGELVDPRTLLVSNDASVVQFRRSER
jgi:hypothetical protein